MAAKGDIERRFIGAAELRAAPPEGEGAKGPGKIEGYAALFGVQANFGWMIEEIAPGAFDGVMDADVRCLHNHDMNRLLGRTRAGTLTLEVTDQGLRYICDLPDSSLGRDVEASVARGDITQSSFAFRVAEEQWEFSEDPSKPDKRTITKFAELIDVSPVTYPAYEDTTVAKRSKEEQSAKVDFNALRLQLSKRAS